MADRVEIKIVGDESGAQAALRRASSAVSDAAATMRNKLAEIQSNSRNAFNGMGNEAKEGASDVNQAMGRMTSTFDNVKAHFASFISGFKQGWREADDEIKKVQRSSEEASNEMGKTSSKGGGGLSGAMAVFKGGLMLEAVSRLKDMTVGVATTSAEFERLRSVLATLEGGSTGGNARFADLKKFATETPYELTEVVGAFAKLKAQGLDPSNAALKSYGNTAAAMGKNLDQMVEAVADAAMGEYERLKEFGIKAVDAGDHVVMNFKGQATSVAKNSADIQAYLQKVGNTDFAGAMDRQMDTLGGKFSNVADAAAGFADEVGQGGLSQALKDAADAMTGATGSSTEMAHGIGQILGVAVSSVVEIIRTMQGVCNDTFNLVRQIVTDTMGKSAGSAITFGNTLKSVATLISAFADVVQWAFQIVWTAVQSGISAVVTFATAVDRMNHLDLGGMVEAVADGVKQQVTIFQNGTDRMVEINRKGQQRIAGIWASNTKGPASLAMDAVNEVLAAGNTSAPKGMNFARAKGGGGGRHAGGAKGGGSAPSEMDQWRAQYQDGALEEERAGRDTIAYTVKFWQEKLAVTKAGTKQELDVKRELSRAQIAMARETQREEIAQIRDRQQMKLDAAQNDIELTRLALQEKLDAIDQETAAGNLSQTEALRQKAQVNAEIYKLDLDLERRQYEIKATGLREQRSLYAAGTRDYREFTRQIELIDAQHNQRMAVIDRQNQARMRRDNAAEITARRQTMQSIASTWAQQLARMATLQQGFVSTVRGLWQGLVGIVADVLQQIIEKWIISQLIKIGLIKTEHATTVSSEASKAGAGGVASMAAAPFPLNLTAPGFGASMAAAAAAFGSVGFSAMGGYDVPSMAGPGIDGRGGQLGVVHPREMVLPEELANKIRSGGGSGGVSVHLHGNVIHGTRELKKFAEANAAGITAGVKKYARNNGR